MGEREISFLPHVRVIWTRIISVYHFWGPQHLGQYHLSLNRIPSCSLSYYFGTFEAFLLLLSHIEYPIDYEQSLLFGEVRPAARKYQFFFTDFFNSREGFCWKGGTSRSPSDSSSWLRPIIITRCESSVNEISHYNTLPQTKFVYRRTKRRENKEEAKSGWHIFNRNTLRRVSIGLTVSRETTKNLRCLEKNWHNLATSGEKSWPD